MGRLLNSLILIGYFTSSAYGQNVKSKQLHIIPEISAGYIFGVSFSWGMGINVTSFDFNINDNINSSSGLGVSMNRFRYNNTSYINYAFNLVNFSDYTQFKIGINRMKIKWGFDKRNKSQSNNVGFNMEVGGSFGKYSPWVTFRVFKESNQCLWLPIRKQYQFNIIYLYDFQLL